jgi:hypothetical protein
MAYFKVEKPRILFLEGSAGTKATAAAAAVAPPDASAAGAGTSAARAASSVDRLAAGSPAPAPGACSSAASAALGEGGACSHLSGGPAPRRFPILLLPPTTSTPTLQGDRVPAAHAAGTLHLSAPCTGSRAPSSAPPAPVSITAPRARVPGLGVWVGQTAQRSRPPYTREDEMLESRRHMAKG